MKWFFSDLTVLTQTLLFRRKNDVIIVKNEGKSRNPKNRKNEGKRQFINININVVKKSK